MPMNRKLYPKDWDSIAFRIKDNAGWVCQNCDKLCIGHPDRQEVAILGNRSERGRYTLTVAHLDHNPANCEDTNLKALCAPCHLRYDNLHRMKKRLKNPDQLEIF